MNRIWILEELTDTPYPEFSFEEIHLTIQFCIPEYLDRVFKILSVVPVRVDSAQNSTPIMGFDEWW